ncbi:SusD/RagB family nutrient-binding outer membrane lipoprotein [Flavobacterium zepuense]|uniref:SusD/RagB family nutrient-binding outer membrane lipoprotein n=1 Tax=Flavobacterium zepuense TaxID=2593302 RepID=A0A552V7B8_9FLAO|nr:SusD/RagB family nutrient-binding outer membrane lipoprotein [Flavobacterium zepuense]TRW26363.1 SusD/RagB family nutrient-binding outer membrane lipoprotein [Flavobacterium zepuense]
MKKILYTASAFLLVLASCTSDDSNFNRDQDRSYDVPAETLLANAQRELTDQLVTPEVNLNPLRFYTQYWAATQYPAESRYNLVTRTIADNLWDNLFRDVLGNLESAKDVIEVNPDLDDATKQNQIAIIEIIEVYTYQILVDTFGDIPYSQSLDVLNVLPAYDDDATIYPQLITRLDAALTNLNDGEGTFTTGDVIYSGSVAKWRLFGNSLKVKLGINLSDVNPSLAQSTIESAVADGVITDNSDNATLRYPGSAPFYNPIYAQLVASNRNDFVASESIVNQLNDLDDPRRSAYFELDGTGVYSGGINGAGNGYFNFSPIAESLTENNVPGVLFEATEINFYLAEAAARGYSVNGTIEEYYEAAITTSFEFWGVGDVETYLANPDVAYATAQGDWKQKIGMQEWIAFFNRPFESWTAWRRLDVPSLTPAINAVPASEGQIPVRFTYPIDEQTVNNTNWTAASNAIGGDKLTTRVFWDLAND